MNRSNSILSAYKQFPCKQDACYYCGLSNEEIDHCPPYSEVREWGVDFFVEHKVELVTVPSCRECNAHLYNYTVFTPARRKEFIKYTLRKKYKKLFDMPWWEEKELNELGYTLRTTIESALQAKRVLMLRLLH